MQAQQLQNESNEVSSVALSSPALSTPPHSLSNPPSTPPYPPPPSLHTELELQQILCVWLYARTRFLIYLACALCFITRVSHSSVENLKERRSGTDTQQESRK